MKRTTGSRKEITPTKKPTKKSKAFIDAAAMPGMSNTQALRVANAVNGDPKHGMPGNLDHIHAYNKSKELRDHIEYRKQLALEFVNVTPEMVLGATAMRAFGSPDGAFDEFGRFDIKLARKTGAIHLLKKLKSTPNGLEAEFYSNETAQQQLANYLGMEFAPREQTDNIESLKAGVETVARGIANDLKTEITREIRLQALEMVMQWVRENKARYSPQALEEVRKQYGASGAVIETTGQVVEDANGGGQES